MVKAPRSSSRRSSGSMRVLLKGPRRTQQLPTRAAAIEGVEPAGLLNGRLQLGRYPLHGAGLADDLIDVIAVDALKRAQLESNSRGLDAHQDHRLQTLGTDMGPNCYAACVEQDCYG